MVFDAIQQWDFSILQAIQHSRTSLGDIFLPWVSRLANGGLLWIVLTLLLFVFRPYRYEAKENNFSSLLPGLSLTLALALDFISVNLILKPLFHRPRPCDLLPIVDMLVTRPLGWSMPSGHTTVSFTAAMVLFTLNRKWGICAFLLAALIGFSRMYLYVHFPTDVLVGAVCGIGIGWAGSRLAAQVITRLPGRR